jgi:hypothetical protein
MCTNLLQHVLVKVRKDEEEIMGMGRDQFLRERNRHTKYFYSSKQVGGQFFLVPRLLSKAHGLILYRKE